MWLDFYHSNFSFTSFILFKKLIWLCIINIFLILQDDSKLICHYFDEFDENGKYISVWTPK